MTDNLPIIVGVGQITQRPDNPDPQPPLSLMATAARRAEEDAGAKVLASLDSVRVVNIMSWAPQTPAEDLARELGASPREHVYTAVGGNTPQWQVNEAAEAIHRGDLRSALIAGAEAVHSSRRARTSGRDLGWHPRGRPEPNAGDQREGIKQVEAAHGATVPVQVYPLFENALRYHYGQTIPEHQAVIGELFARFASVAAENPYAWFRQARTSAEIATPTAENRYIGFPYTKYMNAIIDVDQGAALLLTSVAEARRLRIPEEKWVYLWGCGDATDHWFVTDRVNYYTSPAIRTAGQRALSMAGVAIDEVGYFDLYSCFPSAVQITRDMLGIAPDDPRPLTVTGGLPYFGGPGNNYVTHSIASMVERLRADRGAIGLVTANGWYVTKHSTGIYSSEPPRREWERTPPRVDQEVIDAEPHPPFEAAAHNGPATVETYTVLFDRAGEPERGIVIGRLESGERVIANTPADRQLLREMTEREMVGTGGRVETAEGLNQFHPS